MKAKKVLKRWGIATLLLIAAIYYWNRRWTHIVIHHSAGQYGNIEFLQQIHDERQAHEPLHAIAYHYAIGNGNGMPDGEVGSDIRKRYNLWGAHMSLKNMTKNIFGLGICVIGNLDQQAMSSKQYESLVALTKELMSKYGIPPENVHFHGKVSGEQTQCPGKLFPYERFKNDLR